jgi:hypothetical protein
MWEYLREKAQEWLGATGLSVQAVLVLVLLYLGYRAGTPWLIAAILVGMVILAGGGGE